MKPAIIAVCPTAVTANATQQAPVALRSNSSFAVLAGDLRLVTVDGIAQGDRVVPLVDDHQQHTVEVRIPAARG